MKAYEYLRSYAKRIQQNKELPFMVDILNCAKGCLYGTATDSKRGTDDVMLTIAKLRNSKTSAKQEKAHFGRKSKKQESVGRYTDTGGTSEKLHGRFWKAGHQRFYAQLHQSRSTY